jgi:S1-C subfamily serine protease
MFALRSLFFMSLLAGCATSVDPVTVEVDVPVETPGELSTNLERAAVEIWTVDAQNGHCGGFVQSATVVVTAAHCVPQGANDLLFRRLGSNEIESAHVAYINREPLNDIAYLTPDRASSDYLSSRSLRDGEHGTLLRPLWGTRISGIVERVVFDDGITRPVLWGKGAHGGDSGSPVVADDGEVIGIVSAGVWSAPNQPITGVTVVPVPAPPWQKPH